MKRLVDQIVDSHLASQQNSQVIGTLAKNLQVDGDKILLGTPRSYIEVGGEGQIALVSDGQRIEFADLLRFGDIVTLFNQENSGGTDEDYDGIDPDLELHDLDPNEAVLELDPDTPQPEVIEIESTTLIESPGGSLGGTQGWNLRSLNQVNPPRDWLALSNGSFTLEPGNYNVMARCPALNCDSHQAKLVGDGREWIGSSVQTVYEFIDGRDRQQAIATDSWVFASVSVETAAEFTLLHYIKQRFPFGVLGAGGEAPDTPVIYSQAMVTKLS